MDEPWIGALVIAGVLTGFAIPIFINGFFILQEMIQSTPRAARKSLRRLNQAIFSCFDPDYPNNVYLFERRIHQQKRYFMRAIRGLPAVCPHLAAPLRCRPAAPDSNIRGQACPRDPDKTAETDQLNQLFDVIMNYAQLRWRVTDFTVFLICQKELSSLSQAIDTMLLEKQKDHSQFEMALRQFEEVYQQVLQVSSPDPLAFLLFITGIKGLRREGK